MDRILQNTAATISVTVEQDGTATNPSPDSATVTITRANGTVLVAAASATDTGVGSFSYTLSPTQTALLDRLKAVWTVTLNGFAQTLTTRVEVVGGFVFSLAEFKALRDVSDASPAFTTAQLQEARTLAESDLEEALDFALVPRYERETLNGTYSNDLTLKFPYVRSIRSATVDGTAYTAGELANLTPLGIGSIYGTSRWATGYGNVIVDYEHGLDAPPGPVKRAALILARDRLTDGPTGSRQLQAAAADAGVAINLAVPGLRGSLFGIPEVDAVVDRYGLTVPGVA